MLLRIKIVLMLCFALLSTSPMVAAQMFGDSEAPVKPSVQNRDWRQNSQTYGQNNNQPKVQAPPLRGRAANAAPNAPKTPTKSTIQPLRPTLDGAKRGAIGMSQVVSTRDGLKNIDTSSIFLYYSNFVVRKGLTGSISCDVRFIVMTTLDKKLSNLSIKLKWPSIETALNFDDVAPNVENYFDYTLVGDGCYSMDKIPNVIVNRCRVSGMSQEDCAAKIRWLKKQ